MVFNSTSTDLYSVCKRVLAVGPNFKLLGVAELEGFFRYVASFFFKKMGLVNRTVARPAGVLEPSQTSKGHKFCLDFDLPG